MPKCSSVHNFFFHGKEFKSISIWHDCGTKKDESSSPFYSVEFCVSSFVNVIARFEEMVQILIANWCANSVSFIQRTSYFFLSSKKRKKIFLPISWNWMVEKNNFCTGWAWVWKFFRSFHDQSLIKIRIYKWKWPQCVKHSKNITCVRCYL